MAGRGPPRFRPGPSTRSSTASATCEWYNTPLFGPDGTFQGVLSLAQDVTARQKAEHALLLRDRAIRAVVGGILITDANAPDHPISFVSPGFERLTGYTRDEALGRNCRFLQGKDTDRAVVAEVREAVRDGVPIDVKLLNYLKDGTPFWNALSISPVHDDAGRLTHFIGVQTDVTGRRKLENQFHQAQKMEAVGQLAGGVAHDFNNLLTVINGHGEIVHDALPPGHPSRELVAEITKAGGGRRASPANCSRSAGRRCWSRRCLTRTPWSGTWRRCSGG